jgi:hypothetical protein
MRQQRSAVITQSETAHTDLNAVPEMDASAIQQSGSQEATITG